MRGAVLALLLAVGLTGTGAAAAEEEKPTIVMGVRVDAPPFAWRDEANGGYMGFLVDLCVDATTRAGYPVRQVAIDAAARRDFFEGRGPKLDLLCDPTTLTLARIGEFAALGTVALEFTPIVFVANGSYVVNEVAGSGVLPEAEVDPAVCPTAAAPAPAAEAAAGASAAATPKTTGLAAGFVVGTTGEEVLRDAVRAGALRLGEGEVVCPVEQATHWDAGRAFCAGELRYYFGDQDMLRSVLAMTAAREGGCAAASAPRPLSYEPYALVVSGETAGFRQAFVKALYEVFHHETAGDRFRGNFDGRPMSPFLDTLFRINRIPAGAPSGPVRRDVAAATASVPADAPAPVPAEALAPVPAEALAPVPAEAPAPVPVDAQAQARP